MLEQEPCERCGGRLVQLNCIVPQTDNNAGKYECTRCGQEIEIEPLFEGTFEEFHKQRLEKEKHGYHI